MDLLAYKDECKFTLDVTIPQAHGKEYNHRRRKRPIRGISVMIWDCISRNGLILPRKLEGTLTTVKYCGFLKDDVLPILKAKYKRF